MLSVDDVDSVEFDEAADDRDEALLGSSVIALVELLDTVIVVRGVPVVTLLLSEAGPVPKTDVVTVVSRVELLIEVTVRELLLEDAAEVSDEELGKVAVEFNAIIVDTPEEVSDPLLVGGSVINVVDAVPLKEEIVTDVPFPEVSVIIVDGALVVPVRESDPLGVEVVPTVTLLEDTVMVDPLTTDSDKVELETRPVVTLTEALDSTDDVDAISEVLAGLAKVVFGVEDDAILDSPVKTNTEVARTELDALEEALRIELVSLIAEVVPAVLVAADKEESSDNEEADALLRDSVSMIVVVTVKVEKMEAVAEVGNGLSVTTKVVGDPVPVEVTDTELSVVAMPVDAFDAEDESPEVVPIIDSVVLGIEVVPEDRLVAGEDLLIPVKLAVKPDVTTTVVVMVVLPDVTVWFSVAVILMSL